MPPLRSGNGRHRRPRQAPAYLLTAGVTGVGIATSLLGATGAQAADTTTWDRVAQCESGGLWSANQDNGYYGGLQLSKETWEQYGGTDYAERPDLASRGQQITVAEKIFDAKGPDAWSSCADEAGLTKDSTEAPDVDPGDSNADASAPVPERPYSSPPETTPSPSETTPGDDASGPDSGDGDASGDSPSDTSTGTTDSGTTGSDSDVVGLPDHALLPAPSESPSQSDEPGAPDDSASSSQSPSPSDSPSTDPSTDGEGTGTGKHRGAPAEHPSRDGGDGRDARGKAGSDGSHSGAREHRVTHGESLSRIADENDVRGGWTELYERNRDVVGSDPDLILPGQELRL